MENASDFRIGDSSLINDRIRSLEERNRIIKDQIALLNKNLVEAKDSSSAKIIDLRKEIENLKESISQISRFLETVSAGLSKFAKKEDIDILYRYAKMFNPDEIITKKEFSKYISDGKIKKDVST